MTVKLLVDWKDPSTGRQYRIGNLLDTDDYTEAGLIASKQAQADLTGGTAQTDPVVNHGDGQVVRANPAGTALVVDGHEVPLSTHTGTSSLGVSVADYQTLTGHSCSNNGTMSLVSGNVPQIGKTGYSIKVTVPAGETSIFSFPSWTAVNNPGNNFALVIENHTLATDGYINWYTAVQSAYTDHYYTTCSLNKYGLQAFVRAVGSAVSDWTVGGGSPTPSTITRGRCNIVAPASEAAVVTFHLMSAAAWSPPLIQIICDDGGIEGYRELLPLLNEYGFKAGFAIIGSLIGTTNYMTTSMLDQLYADGHDLIPHGATNLSSLSLAAALADVDSNANYLINRGYHRGRELYVYPNGVEYHSATDKTSIINHLVARGVKQAYLASGNTTYAAKGLNKYGITRYNCDAAVNTTTLLNHIDKAWECGMGMTLMIHQIVASGATGGQVNRSDMDTILSGIATREKAGKLIVARPSDTVLALA